MSTARTTNIRFTWMEIQTLQRALELLDERFPTAPATPARTHRDSIERKLRIAELHAAQNEVR